MLGKFLKCHNRPRTYFGNAEGHEMSNIIVKSGYLPNWISVHSLRALTIRRRDQVKCHTVCRLMWCGSAMWNQQFKKWCAFIASNGCEAGGAWNLMPTYNEIIIFRRWPDGLALVRALLQCGDLTVFLHFTERSFMRWRRRWRRRRRRHLCRSKAKMQCINLIEIIIECTQTLLRIVHRASLINAIKWNRFSKHKYSATDFYTWNVCRHQASVQYGSYSFFFCFLFFNSSDE